MYFCRMMVSTLAMPGNTMIFNLTIVLTFVTSQHQPWQSSDQTRFSGCEDEDQSSGVSIKHSGGAGESCTAQMFGRVSSINIFAHNLFFLNNRNHTIDVYDRWDYVPCLSIWFYLEGRHINFSFACHGALYRFLLTPVLWGTQRYTGPGMDMPQSWRGHTPSPAQSHHWPPPTWSPTPFPWCRTGTSGRTRAMWSPASTVSTPSMDPWQWGLGPGLWGSLSLDKLWMVKMLTSCK